VDNIKTRDFIASQAMQILLERAVETLEKYSIHDMAKDAYTIADAMIVASAK
jgi:hypothetical protein